MSRVLVLKGREGGAASEACHEARLKRSGEPHSWVLGLKMLLSKYGCSTIH